VAKQFPDRLRVFAQMDERLAHRIIAGTDMILVPSRFEPCGLTQLYGLKYGSVPIVRRTGGLVDTVTDCTPETLAAGTATGFLFDDPTPEALADCIGRALDLYRDAASWKRLMAIGMSQDWSWESSAKRYLDLYAEAQEIRKLGD
jgi:starch synthase